jgi:hypothetical protein
VIVFLDASPPVVRHCVQRNEEGIVKRTITLVIIALALFACKQKTEVATTTTTVQTAMTASDITATTASLPPNHPAMGATSSNNNIGAKVTGTVLETFDAAGYTYLRLKTATGEEWAAVRQTPVKKGQTVTMEVQMTAEKFESKTLKKTFDRILFGALEGPSAVPQAQQHMSAPAAADNTPIKVAKAEGGVAKTVAEIWASRESLKDGNVVVRGKVVKFLGGIMGKNWIHLRDGSGSADKGDNDIAVTTSEMAAVGDVVVISGVVHVDKDFGAGYRYPVIIEDAKVTK